MPKIFISYREEDTGATCPLVSQWLAAEYGPDAIMRDLMPELAGPAYRARLETLFRQGVVVVALAGPAFDSGATPTRGALLSQPDDRMRIELETALALSQPVVLLLVDDTPAPRPEDLPESLRPISSIASLPLHTRAHLFDQEIRQVYAALARWMNPPRTWSFVAETPAVPPTPVAAAPLNFVNPYQQNAFDQTLPSMTSSGPWGGNSAPIAQPASPTISRRAALGGMLGLGVVLAGAGVLWLAEKRTHTTTTLRLTATAGQTGKLLATFARHTNNVDALAWSADGRWIASGAWDNTVRVWDSTTGSERFVFTGHSDHVISVAWSPDGRFIASASDDGTAKIWNAQTGAISVTYAGHGGSSVWSVVWSPDGRLIASGGRDNTAQIWDPNNGQRLHVFAGHSDAVRSVCWSPQGDRIATASYDRTARVWDVASETTLGTYTGHNDKVWVVGWSADGASIASGGDLTVHIWDPSTLASRTIYRQHTGGTWWLAWAPSGRVIASCSADTTVRLWNADDGTTTYVYRGHSASANIVAWSHDSQRIASGSDDHTVQVWSAS